MLPTHAPLPSSRRLRWPGLSAALALMALLLSVGGSAAARCLQPAAALQGPVRVWLCTDDQRRLTLQLENSDAARAATVQVARCQLDYGNGLNIDAAMAWPTVQVPPQGRVTIAFGTQRLPSLHAAQCQLAALTLNSSPNATSAQDYALPPGVPPGSPAQLGKRYGTEPDLAPPVQQLATPEPLPPLIVMPPNPGQRLAPGGSTNPGLPSVPGPIQAPPVWNGSPSMPFGANPYGAKPFGTSPYGSGANGTAVPGPRTAPTLPGPAHPLQPGGPYL